jgi:predicted nucleotidyltransferase
MLKDAPMIQTRIPTSSEKIEAFCRKWKVVEMALFGSVLREDFRPDSDVDVLVTFESEAPWDLWDLIDMRDGLREIFGRDVDLVEKKNLINPFRRHAILSSKQVIYAAAKP